MTEVLDRPDLETKPGSGDDGPRSHIVWVPPELRETMTAQQYVFKCRVEGTVVRALCGYVWVPSRDPLKYPTCEECVEIWKAGGFEELPDA
jgi:hypothetical protein